jgi:hypothetical protein
MEKVDDIKEAPQPNEQPMSVEEGKFLTHDEYELAQLGYKQGEYRLFFMGGSIGRRLTHHFQSCSAP